eukprot:10311392-Lingulodinium_polyedra.AAC.1
MSTTSPLSRCSGAEALGGDTPQGEEGPGLPRNQGAQEERGHAPHGRRQHPVLGHPADCLLYTSDAADDM